MPADESSVIAQHGRDVVIILIFIVTTLMSILGWNIRGSWNALVGDVKLLKEAIWGKPESQDLALEHRMTVMETVCGERSQEEIVKSKKRKR